MVIVLIIFWPLLAAAWFAYMALGRLAFINDLESILERNQQDTRGKE